MKKESRVGGSGTCKYEDGVQFKEEVLGVERESCLKDDGGQEDLVDVDWRNPFGELFGDLFDLHARVGSFVEAQGQTATHQADEYQDDGSRDPLLKSSQDGGFEYHLQKYDHGYSRSYEQQQGVSVIFAKQGLA